MSLHESIKALYVFLLIPKCTLGIRGLPGTTPDLRAFKSGATGLKEHLNVAVVGAALGVVANT